MDQSREDNGNFQLLFWKQMTLEYPDFSNLNVLRYTPSLRVVKIDAYHLSMQESDNIISTSTELEIGGWTLPSLTDLTFNLLLSPRSMKRFVRWMPNVERAYGLRLDDVKFAIVCGNWRKLKELQDDSTELTDDCVIGLRNAQEAGAGDEILENLTYFGTRSSQLTSASVRNGFIKLANLKKLEFGEGSQELDEEAKTGLEERGIEFSHISPDSAELS